MCPPTYKFTREGDTHCLTFTATVEINGASYAGGPANSKEATSNAACEVIRAIDPHYSNSLSRVEIQAESTIDNDSIQHTGECDVNKSELKNPLTSYNQLVEGVYSQSPENSIEKVTVENAPVVEKGSEKRNVEDPCVVGHDLENSEVKDAFEAQKSMSNINHATSAPAEQPHNQPPQDPLPAQQGQSKEEIGDAYPDNQHGSEEIEGNGQGSREVDLPASTSKRSGSESENAEQCERKKNHKKKNKAKRMKTHGTA